MKWTRKILIVLFSLVLLVVLLNIGLNFWVNHQLPKIINRENDSRYSITYEKIEVSLFRSTIIANNVVVVPKEALNDSVNKDGIYGRVRSIEVRSFKIWDVLFNDKIKAKSITIDQPKVIIYKKNQKTNIKESVVGPFDKIIAVSDIFLNDGDLKIFNSKDSKPVLNVQNIDAQLDGIVVDETILEAKIPFQFSNYDFSCDSVKYHSNSFYDITIDNIKSTKSELNISKFEMLPTLSRADFVSAIDKEKDQYTLICKSIKVAQTDWGFKEDDFFFHCNSVNLDEASANIYRSKEPTDDLSKKHLYNKLLREMKFDLKVDTLKIRNSRVEYEEEKSFDLGAGKLTFSRFNLTATSINSGFKKSKLPDVKIKVDCQFMKASPLKVDWKFNVMDKSDGFNIKGTLTNFDTESMIPFTKPYTNVTTDGMMDEIYFNFTGNDRKASGEFAVKYDDLKFTIYKKDDRKKKNKLLTFVSRIFVKKDTNDKVKDADVELERIQEKSFYNFLWRSIAEGLKKILI